MMEILKYSSLNMTEDEHIITYLLGVSVFEYLKAAAKDQWEPVQLPVHAAASVKLGSPRRD